MKRIRVGKEKNIFLTVVEPYSFECTENVLSLDTETTYGEMRMYLEALGVILLKEYRNGKTTKKYAGFQTDLDTLDKAVQLLSFATGLMRLLETQDRKFYGDNISNPQEIEQMTSELLENGQIYFSSREDLQRYCIGAVQSILNYLGGNGYYTHEEAKNKLQELIGYVAITAQKLIEEVTASIEG